MDDTKELRSDFFQGDVDSVARALIGKILLVNGVGGIIVETEAYDANDEGSHSFGGKITDRNKSMFALPGTVYVYRLRGSQCLNFVCDSGKRGSAVLIRSLEPTMQLEAMERLQPGKNKFQLCCGPGNLCKSLGITREKHDGHSLDKFPFDLQERIGASDPLVGITPRVGPPNVADKLRRYLLHGSKFTSRSRNPHSENSKEGERVKL